MILEKKILKYFQYNFTFSLWSTFEKGVGLHLNKFESPLLKDALCQVWFKLAKGFRRRIFLNILNRNLIFRYNLPLEKCVTLHLNKLESRTPKDVLCKVWLKLAQCFWSRRFINIFNLILLFCYYLSLEKSVSFIWTNLNPLHTRMLCVKFGCNWQSGSWEEVENVKIYRQTDRRSDGQTTDKK